MTVLVWQQPPHGLDVEHAGSLVRRVRVGERAAWDELVNRYLGLVWAITRDHELGPTDAADVTQLTFLRLLEHVDRLSDPELVGQWLASTTELECRRLTVMRAQSRNAPQISPAQRRPDPAAQPTAPTGTW